MIETRSATIRDLWGLVIDLDLSVEILPPSRSLGVEGGGVSTEGSVGRPGHRSDGWSSNENLWVHILRVSPKVTEGGLETGRGLKGWRYVSSENHHSTTAY